MSDTATTSGKSAEEGARPTYLAGGDDIETVAKEMAEGLQKDKEFSFALTRALGAETLATVMSSHNEGLKVAGEAKRLVATVFFRAGDSWAGEEEPVPSVNGRRPPPTEAKDAKNSCYARVQCFYITEAENPVMWHGLDKVTAKSEPAAAVPLTPSQAASLVLGSRGSSLSISPSATDGDVRDWMQREMLQNRTAIVRAHSRQQLWRAIKCSSSRGLNAGAIDAVSGLSGSMAIMHIDSVASQDGRLCWEVAAVATNPDMFAPPRMPEDATFVDRWSSGAPLSAFAKAVEARSRLKPVTQPVTGIALRCVGPQDRYAAMDVLCCINRNLHKTSTHSLGFTVSTPWVHYSPTRKMRDVVMHLVWVRKSLSGPEEPANDPAPPNGAIRVAKTWTIEELCTKVQQSIATREEADLEGIGEEVVHMFPRCAAHVNRALMEVLQTENPPLVFLPVSGKLICNQAPRQKMILRVRSYADAVETAQA